MQDIASVDDARAVFAGLCTDNALSDAADHAAADKNILHAAKKNKREKRVETGMPLPEMAGEGKDERAQKRTSSLGGTATPMSGIRDLVPAL
jgi:hypothetical protein